MKCRIYKEKKKMKKINKFKNILRAVSCLVFCLCIFSGAQIFGQRDCYAVRNGSANNNLGGGIMIGGATQTQNIVFVETPNCKAVVGSLRSAGLLIYGIELKPGNKSDDETIMSWLREINQNPVWKAKYNEGFSAADGMNFLKERFKTIGDGWLEVFVGTITDQIYGRTATKEEKDFYVSRLKDQKETYASIFLAEKNKLNKNSTERAAMIERAYQNAMGRTASENDRKYWQPRSEIYKELVAASRDWLYSPNGANDLKETVTRAYQAKYKNSPVVETRIAKLTADFSKSKMIYAEMIKN